MLSPWKDEPETIMVAVVVVMRLVYTYHPHLGVHARIRLRAASDA